MRARTRIGLTVAAFGLAAAGLGTALTLSAPPAAPPTAVGLPHASEPALPTAMPPQPPTTPPQLPTTPPPVVADVVVPPVEATEAVVERAAPERAPAARPEPAPARQQEQAPAPSVAVEQPRSVRADLQTLRERITAKVDKHLKRLKERLHG